MLAIRSVFSSTGAGFQSSIDTRLGFVKKKMRLQSLLEEGRNENARANPTGSRLQPCDQAILNDSARRVHR
jgi:hypothetical protein